MRWWEQTILTVYDVGKFTAQALLFTLMFLLFLALGIGVLILLAFVLYVGVMTMLDVFRPDLLPYP